MVAINPFPKVHSFRFDNLQGYTPNGIARRIARIPDIISNNGNGIISIIG